MAFIPVHQELLDHKKTGRFARHLGIERTWAVGYLFTLWSWALSSASDGVITDLQHVEIAEAMRFSGDAEVLFEALKVSGFIDVTDDAVTLHDWQDYGGKLVSKREADRLRKSNGVPTEFQRSSNGIPKGGDAEFQRTAHVDKKRIDKKRIDKKRIDKIPPISPEGFDEFWQAYPNKIGKGAAEKSWAAIKPSQTRFAAIMAGLDKYKASQNWAKEDGKYIPYPSTWLNQKRWEDDPQPVTPSEPAQPTYTPMERFDHMLSIPHSWHSWEMHELGDALRAERPELSDKIDRELARIAEYALDYRG